MILVFLGSWRSTIIVAVSIPLSVFVSIICLWAMGETLNVMTLGGLALAVGILVDDATVAIENIHRNIEQGKPLYDAIVDGAEQIAIPAFVSTLSICHRVPADLRAVRSGRGAVPPARAVGDLRDGGVVLPLADARADDGGVHAAEGSGRASRGECAASRVGADARSRRSSRVQSRLRDVPRRLSRDARVGDGASRRRSSAARRLFVLASLLLVPAIGEDFFPQVDGGQFQLHVRAPSGTRLEETERLFAQVEQSIKRAIPAKDLQLVLDNIGLPTYGVSLAIGSNATVGPSDGDMLVQLIAGAQRLDVGLRSPAAQASCRRSIPGVTFFFQPADMVNQVLNLGLPAPIDVQVAGRERERQFRRRAEARARDLADSRRGRRARAAGDGRAGASLRRRPHQGAAARPLAARRRERRAHLALVERTDGAELLGRSAQRRAVRGERDDAAVQDGHRRRRCTSTPITSPGVATPQLFGNLATSSRGTSPAVVNHYNVQPIFDVYASSDRRDLGGIARAVDADHREGAGRACRAARTINVRGQVQSMRDSFTGLGLGILFAIMLVYIILVVNFQSWLDPADHHHGAAGRARRHRVDAVHHAHDVHGAVA